MMNELRVVTIQSPYDSWNDPKVQKLFCQLLSIRLAGYQSEYGAGVFPLDSADFIGTHHTICREEDGFWKPLMGFRSTTHEMSRRHGLGFGGLNLAKCSGTPTHVQAMQGIVDHCQSRSIPIAYIASWTMDPAVRQADPVLRKTLRELFMATAVHAYADTGERVIGGCTMRFKMDQWFTRWGFEPVVHRGEPLAPMQVPFLLGEQVRLMYLKRLSPEIIREAEPWRSHWENRLILDDGNSGSRLRRAA